MMGYSEAEIANFRAALNASAADDYVRGPSAPPVPPPVAEAPLPTTGTALPRDNNFYERMQASGTRLAENPVLNYLAPPTSGGLTAVRDRLSGGRQPTSFTRELEDQPQHVELKPLAAGPELTLPNTPTLAQHYGAPAARGGAGGGDGGMGGLMRAYKQAQTNQFGTFDQERDLVERRGELVGERIDKTAQLEELNAARRHRDAEVMAEHQSQVAAKHDAFLQRNQQLADEIGAQKIDPGAVMANKSVGQKIGMMIAGVLSGANGQGPQFMARMDNEISEGVKAQMANVDNMKAKLGARQTLFGQMMAESGDRRVAEVQTKQLMWEAAKQKMAADAARLGIPEVTNNAEMTMNQIEATRINPLRVQMTGEALRAQQAAAAAAAAAQRQAEERAWSRQMQVAEMGFKADELNLKRETLAAKDKDDVNAETAKLGAALADPKLAGGRAAVDNSKRRLGINEDGTVKLDEKGNAVVPITEGLPGVGKTGDLRELVAPKPTGLRALDPGAWLLNKTVGLSDEERVSRGDMEKMALAYQNQVTGAGGSVEEQAKIRKAFLGASTPAEQRNAVAEADALFRQIESRHKAGVSPRALKTFEERLNSNAPSLPDSVRVKR